MATVVACVAVAGGAALPAAAAANQTVVSATIFPGAAGSYSIQPVLLSMLASCPTYTGPSWTFPDGQSPDTTNTAWSLNQILTCGLSVPQTDVTAVQVFNGDNNSDENVLTPDEVFDPDTYPSGALPLVSVDGTPTSGGPVTYTRPPISPSDAAQSDQFTEGGTTPVAIYVYEREPPLNVTYTDNPVAGTGTASSEQVALTATATPPGGGPIDPSQLSYTWTVNGVPTSDVAAPTVSVPPGNSFVSVVVSDASTGMGGTATFPVAYTPPASPTDHNGPHKPGGGTSKHGKNSGTPHSKENSSAGTPKLNGGGALHHIGTNNGASTVRSRQHRTTPSHTHTTPAPAASLNQAATPASQTTTQATTVTTPATTTAPGLTVDSTPTRPPRHKPTHTAKRQSSAQHRSRQRLVTGQLVADVDALPAGASPLVHPVAAQAAAPSLVHAASDGTSAPTWVYAALAVLALLGGGALYERRGRRGRTLHR